MTILVLPRPMRARIALGAISSLRLNPRFLLSGIPALTFWIATHVAATEVAIGLSFVSFLAVFQATKGIGAARLLALVSLGVISVGALVGVAATSERAYLAADPVSDLLIAGLFLGSAMIGRPFVGRVIREAVPGLAARLDSEHSLYLWLTIGWGLFNVATAAIRWQMITHLSVGEYLFWSRVLAWPVGYSVMIAMGALLLYNARSQTKDEDTRAA